MSILSMLLPALVPAVSDGVKVWRGCGGGRSPRRLLAPLKADRITTGRRAAAWET
jgi:hypothetical protein